MTDVAPDETASTAGGMPIRILAQFLRDFSFENPRAPDSLRPSDAQPGMEMNVEMSARGRPDGLFEVDLKVSCTAKQGEAIAFQVELVYGGLFEVSGVPEELIEELLLVECPRYLLPFARRIIADATSDGGYPAFLMEPINFHAVFAGQKAAREEQAGSALQ